MVILGWINPTFGGCSGFWKKYLKTSSNYSSCTEWLFLSYSTQTFPKLDQFIQLEPKIWWSFCLNLRVQSFCLKKNKYESFKKISNGIMSANDFIADSSSFCRIQNFIVLKIWLLSTENNNLRAKTINICRHIESFHITFSKNVLSLYFTA